MVLTQNNQLFSINTQFKTVTHISRSKFLFLQLMFIHHWSKTSSYICFQKYICIFFFWGGAESFLYSDKPISLSKLSFNTFLLLNEKKKPKRKNTHNNLLMNLHFFYLKFHKGNVFLNIKVFKVYQIHL